MIRYLTEQPEVLNQLPAPPNITHDPTAIVYPCISTDLRRLLGVTSKPLNAPEFRLDDLALTQ